MAIWPFWPASDLIVALKNEVSTDSTLSLKNKKKASLSPKHYFAEPILSLSMKSLVPLSS